MNEEEHIYLHTLLAHVKDLFGKYGIDYGFKGYDDLTISPTQIYRSKIGHKATFELESELASLITRLIEEDAAEFTLSSIGLLRG